MGRLRAVLLACTVGLAPSAAFAQPKAPPTDAAMTQAKDLVNKAKEKSTAGDHQGAIDLYLAAYNIAPLPLLLSNVGSEYEQLKKSVEALKYYCKYLEAEPDGPMASYATSHAKDLQIQLKNPVDDKNVCAPPKAATNPPPPNPPPPNPPPDPSLGLQKESPAPGTEPVTDPGKGMKTVGLGLGAVGLVGLGVGIVFGIKAQNISDAITHHDPTMKWDDNINAQEADGQHDQTLQITFLIAGGALVATGAVVYVLGRGKSSDEHVSVVPVVAPSYGGFAVGGRF